MDITTITATSKGHRVWLQALATKSPLWATARFNQEFRADGTIVLTRDDNGKRKVTQSKGGIIDIVGKKVTQWADGAESAVVSITDETITIIAIEG